MPKIPLDDPRYVTNLSVKSNDRNLISRNEGGNLIQVTGELLYIETPTYIYDNTAINNVLKTNFEYYKFPSRIVVVDDVDLGIIPIEELNIEIPDEPIKIRYRLNEQPAPVLLTSAEVEEKIVKNKDTSNTRFVYDGNEWTLESRIEGSFTELQFGTVLEGMPQTLANRFTVTQDIIDRNADLAFNIKIALRMTDNHGRNNYAARLLKYNPDTNKYAVLAQKTSVSPKAFQYLTYIETQKIKQIDELRQSLIPKRDVAYKYLKIIVDDMINFVSKKEKDAKGVQTSELFTLFNYTTAPSSLGPRRSGYNNRGYNFWIGVAKEKRLTHWFQKANQITNRDYPIHIAMIISAGQTQFPNNADVIKKIQELKGILINVYLYDPSQIDMLVDEYIHYIYSFLSMWSEVNNNDRGADKNIPEFQEYYQYDANEYLDRIFPGSTKGLSGEVLVTAVTSLLSSATGISGQGVNNILNQSNIPGKSLLTKTSQTIDVTNAKNTKAITVYNGKIKVNDQSINFDGVTNDNYKDAPFAALMKINAIINYIDQTLVPSDIATISKNVENIDRNFIPADLLVEPSIYAHNLEANVMNAAADIVAYEKEGLKYAVDAINSYNKLTSSDFKIPTNYEQAYRYIQELKTSADYKNKINKLNLINRTAIQFKFRSQQISKNLGQRYVYEQRYEQAQRQLKSYQDFDQTIKLTDLLTYDPAKLGYLWSSDLPYTISINEIIPKAQLKLHDSYAVELVTNPAKSVPHQLIEDQTYWTITELENTEVKFRTNETSTQKRTKSVINSAENPNFNSNIGTKTTQDIDTRTGVIQADGSPEDTTRLNITNNTL